MPWLSPPHAIGHEDAVSSPSVPAPAALRRFLAAYVLANLGIYIGFVPILSLLLPRRVAAIDPANSVATLSIVLLVGSLVASIANVLAGSWSDRAFTRTGNRRRPAAIGAAALVGTHTLVAAAHDLTTLVVAVAMFQLSLNVALAPIAALFVDHVPDRHKGRISGLMSAGMPGATLVVAALGLADGRDQAAPFLLSGALAAGCMVPLLLIWPRHAALPAPPPAVAAQRVRPANLALAWVSRFLIQLGATLLGGFIFLHLTALTPRVPAIAADGPSHALGILSLVGMIASAAAPLAGGWASDRAGRRRALLAGSALASAAALLVVAAPPGWPILVAAYAMVSSGLVLFLALHGAMTGQLLAGHPRRGALLGVFNLTNTVPSMLVPIATLAMAHVGLGLGGMFVVAAVSSAVAALLAVRVRGVD